MERLPIINALVNLGIGILIRLSSYLFKISLCFSQVLFQTYKSPFGISPKVRLQWRNLMRETNAKPTGITFIARIFFIDNICYKVCKSFWIKLWHKKTSNMDLNHTFSSVKNSKSIFHTTWAPLYFIFIFCNILRYFLSICLVVLLNPVLRKSSTLKKDVNVYWWYIISYSWTITIPVRMVFTSIILFSTVVWNNDSFSLW